MKLEDLKIKYDKLQKKYGAKELDLIYNGGCADNEYKFYSVFYPVGNGRFNINKSIEDINWIGDRK